MAWSPPISLDKLVSLPQRSSWLFLPSAELQLCAVMLGFCTWVLEIELGSSCFQSEALYPLGHPPSSINTGVSTLPTGSSSLVHEYRFRVLNSY